MTGFGVALAWSLVRTSGLARALLLASCTAIVSGLLLVAVTLALLPAHPDEMLFALVAEPGLRGGTAFATVALTVPPLLLLHQAVRLGSASRERRLAALRLAGATPGEVRRLGAVEVGVPAFAGGVLGIGVFAVLRSVLGGTPSGSAASVAGLRLVPTTVSPAWWHVLIVVASVTLAGVVVGLSASRRLVVTPLGVTRRALPPPPRPWGLALIVLGVALVPLSLMVDADGVILGCIALLLLGLLMLSPWVAHRAGLAAARRATSASVLLAARRLVAEPRPAGRAAAAVGAIAAVAGAATAVLQEVLRQNDEIDSFFTLSLTLVGLALLIALSVVTGTLAVHSVETLLDRKRSMASLVALGTPVDVLTQSQRWEAALVAVPMAVAGMALGGSAMWLMGDIGPRGIPLMLGALVAVVGLVGLAIVVAVGAVRPWTRQVAAAGNLRTE